MPRDNGPIGDLIALLPDATTRPTWEDIERRALTDVYLHRLVTLVSTGACSREEGLIAVALALSSSLSSAQGELLKHAMERVAERVHV